MEPALVDTDVVSYLFKNDTRSLAFERLLDGRALAVSFMTVAELRLWTRRRDWGTARQNALETYLRRFAVFAWEDALASVWAEVVDGALRRGRPIQVGDAWIAATALLHGLPLVTHNPGDYAGVAGLRLLTA